MAHPMGTSISINSSRLEGALKALGAIGAYTDEATGIRGVNRLALTQADGAGRKHVVERMRELGLAVTIDAIGNVYGRRPGLEDPLRPVMVGSHIDSVPTAGIFDGCLGVMGGLEIIRTLEEAGVRTRRPIVVAFFTDEEGSRFGTDMLGSAVATGRIPLMQAYALADAGGARVRDELGRIGFLGLADVRLAPPHAYLECHIEQGPSLRAAGLDIGVVSGVQAISWHEVSIVGKSAHAGTTPMSLRADAGVAAARINLKLREMVASGQFGREMRATMGAITLVPGLVNVVPGRATATVDLRNPDDQAMARAEVELKAFYENVASDERVEVRWRQTAKTAFVPFAQAVRERVARAAEARGLKAGPIISGAGHDAQEIARIATAGMVFVPGEFEGISHNPREYSTPEQCRNGVNILMDVLLSFAEEGGSP